MFSGTKRTGIRQGMPQISGATISPPRQKIPGGDDLKLPKLADDRLRSLPNAIHSLPSLPRIQPSYQNPESSLNRDLGLKGIKRKI